MKFEQVERRRLFGIDQMNTMIVEQAKRKGWNNTLNWLFRKLFNEINELDIAIQEGRCIEEKMIEYIDVQYLLAQIKYEFAENESVVPYFDMKYASNEVTKKKTFDDKSQKVVKK